MKSIQLFVILILFSSKLLSQTDSLFDVDKLIYEYNRPYRNIFDKKDSMFLDEVNQEFKFLNSITSKIEKKLEKKLNEESHFFIYRLCLILQEEYNSPFVFEFLLNNISLKNPNSDAIRPEFIEFYPVYKSIYQSNKIIDYLINSDYLNNELEDINLLFYKKLITRHNINIERMIENIGDSEENIIKKKNLTKINSVVDNKI